MRSKAKRATTTTASTISTTVASPLVSDVSRVTPKSRSDVVNSSTNRAICTTKPETESITPAAIASVGLTPNRWKKRTLMATRAAVLGIARLT